jgi:hypothetical protein
VNAKDNNLFWTYFDVADETYDHPDLGPLERLTLNDLDPKQVETARVASERYALPWPPHLPCAEEIALDLERRLTRRDNNPDGDQP